MLDVGAVLTKGLLRKSWALSRRPGVVRMRARVDANMWGQGGKITPPTLRQRILSAFAPIATESDAIVAMLERRLAVLDATMSAKSSVRNDWAVVHAVLCDVIKSRMQADSREQLDRIHGDGFTALRCFDAQADLLASSSISKCSNGLLCDIQSTFLPVVSQQQETYMHAYGVYFENQSDNILQVLGRSWTIHSDDDDGHSNDGGNDQTVEDPNGGVVGHYPKLGPGEAFYYVSGTSLPSSVGFMQGEFNVVKYPRDDDGEEPSKECFFSAKVSPFRLDADADFMF
jgi:ApaG protein